MPHINDLFEAGVLAKLLDCASLFWRFCFDNQQSCTEANKGNEANKRGFLLSKSVTSAASCKNPVSPLSTSFPLLPSVERAEIQSGRTDSRTPRRWCEVRTRLENGEAWGVRLSFLALFHRLAHNARL